MAEIEDKVYFRFIILWGLPIVLVLLIGLSYLPVDRFTREWTNYPGVHPVADPRTVDASGKIWFSYGYEGGVKVLDGADWKVYTSENSDLVNDQVNDIMTDPSGNIWIATADGLNVVDGGEWTTYTTENSGLYSNRIETMAVDPSGDIWIVTADGLNVYDGANWRKTPLEDSGIFSKHLTDMIFDHSGNVWIICSDDWYGRVKYYDGEKWNTVDRTNSGISANSAYALSMDPSGRIWIGAVNGVNVFDGSSWKNYKEDNSGLLCNYINSFAFEPSGKVWIGTLLGTSVFDPGKESPSTTLILGVRNYLFHPESIWFASIALGFLWLAVFDKNIYVLSGPVGWILTLILGPPSYKAPIHLAIMAVFGLGAVGAQVGGQKPGDAATRKKQALIGLFKGLGLGILIAGCGLVLLWMVSVSM